MSRRIRLVQAIARIVYPSAWRARYSREFDAVLEDCKPGVAVMLDVVKAGLAVRLHEPWGFLRVASVAALLGLLMASGIAFRIRDQYLSEATVRVAVPGEAIGRNVVAALSQENLKAIADRLRLFEQDRHHMSESVLVGRMKRSILISKGGQDGLVRVAFLYDDREKALEATREVLRLLTENSSSGALEVLDMPHQPGVPIYPNRLVIAAIGGFGGGTIGLMLAAIRRSRFARG